MPICRLPNGKLLSFVHVPKCAGTAVGLWLDAAFGPLAFRNPRYLALPETDRWTRTSPQHIDRAAMELLFPASFFDATLALVRHPVNRLISVFRFQREIENTIPADTSFSEWIAGTRPETPWIFDNHARPMNDLVPDHATVFALEDGLSGFQQSVEALAGVELPAIVPKNVMKEKLAHLGRPSQPVVPTDKDLDRIGALYAVDFERFGYSLKEWSPTK